MRIITKAALCGAAFFGLAGMADDGIPGPAQDPYIWLEDTYGEKAMGWVEGENIRTLGLLTRHPLYDTFFNQALEISEAQDRIPSVTIRRDGLYNFWQDADHVRGILRRTSMESYRTDSPDWETVLDVDALGKAEGKSWVYKGLNCLMPEERYCLLSLSNAGLDATEVREFDLKTGKFVEGGFTFPEGRQFMSWLDKDTLLVARDWDGQSMTESLYPYSVRILKRGQKLEEAEEIYRGEKSDVGSFGFTMTDNEGTVHAIGISRYVNIFESRSLILKDGELVELDIPGKVSPYGIVDGRMLYSLSEEWTHPSGVTFAADALVSFDLDEWKADPNGAAPSLAWQPGAKQTRTGAAITSDGLYISLLDNVRGKVVRLDFERGDWVQSDIDLPANARIDIDTNSDSADQLMFSVQDFLSPERLYFYDGAKGEMALLKSAPERFDASNLMVEQFEATSKDGTKIPYFVVRSKDTPMDGSTPTLLNGYGGYQVPQLPFYSGTRGKLWLERGNAFVVANLRGGGEFGPLWHQAAQKANKQRTWDDFIAVGDDLVKRGLTSPEHLGAVGGSQGGLLVGTAITQRPDLFKAAIVQVPLFDMLRYHLIGNGASWIGEYGDPRKPDERAWIEAYSPYQKLQPGTDWPTAFFVTSTADDRVTPNHGRKAAARMAELGEEYYYYENVEGGHAAAADKKQEARRIALEFTFATQELGGK